MLNLVQLEMQISASVIDRYCAVPLLLAVSVQLLGPAVAMSTSKYTVDAKVPADFPLVLKEFSREVLRAQPTNIYEFGAQFFKQKLAERGSAPVSCTIRECIAHVIRLDYQDRRRAIICTVFNELLPDSHPHQPCF